MNEAAQLSPAYFSLRELAVYSGLGVRTLRACLHDPVAPLPYFRIGGGKVLVRRAEFDAWMERFRATAPASIDAIVDDLLRKVS